MAAGVVERPASRPVPEPVEANSRRALASLAQFGGLLAGLWCVFCGLYKAFPHIRSGAAVIYNAKVAWLDRGLDADLVIFGNSKVLTGFVPASFDSAYGGIRSYNLGLPDEERFIANLEQLATRGRPPRIILLTMTRSTPEPPTTAFHYLSNDRTIVDRLFPFRHFPRDLTLFVLRAHTRGGLTAFYRQSETIVARMQADRGYYFIEGQSHYPGHRLPPEFHLPTDRPEFVNVRASLKVSDLARLRSVAERYGMQIWLVPSYYRPGEYALPPAENSELAALVHADSRLHLAGPDYWILPLEFFSDGGHLNPNGAQEYTRRLAELLRQTIR